MPDTNFKEQDPKRQYNTPDNPKDRSGSYDSGQDFDPTEGYDTHPDDHYTSDMVHEEDEFFANEAHQYAEDGEDAEADEDEDEDEDFDDDMEDEELDEDEDD